MSRIMDLAGRIFGRLTVTDEWQTRGLGKRSLGYWLCECSCGNKLWVRSGHLVSGQTKACGCYCKETMHKRFFRDLADQEFGRLKVTKHWKSERVGRKSRCFWLCKCECGTETWVAAASLVHGHTTSCGCRRREAIGAAHSTHGHTKKHQLSRSYISSIRMRQRGSNRKLNNAHRYVKRGITVDPHWESFEVFLADMGERPIGRSLDRINNNLGYFKENCKWSTPSEQARNRSDTKLTFDAAVEVALRAIRGELHKDIAADFAISRSMVGSIATEKRWKDALPKALARARSASKMPAISDRGGAARLSEG